MSEIAQPEVDMKSAATYLKLASDAYECGDDNKFIAARKLLMVSLGVADAPPIKPMISRGGK